MFFAIGSCVYWLIDWLQIKFPHIRYFFMFWSAIAPLSFWQKFLWALFTMNYLTEKCDKGCCKIISLIVTASLVKLVCDSVYSENSDILYCWSNWDDRTVCNKSVSSFVCLSLAIRPQCVQILWDGFRGPQWSAKRWTAYLVLEKGCWEGKERRNHGWP